MTLYSFVNELWKMIRDYMWLILGTVAVVIVAGFGFQYVINLLDSDSESQLELVDDNSMNQVGVVSIHADNDFETIRLNPELHPDVIDEINGMKGFSVDFAINTGQEEELGNNSEEPIIDLETFETANILELLLGIDPTQHAEIFQDPQTGNLRLSLEINAESGDVKLVEATNTTDVIDVQMNLNEESNSDLFELPSTDVDLMNIGWTFSPNGDQLMQVSTIYDLISGMNYPIQLNDNRKNITVSNPSVFEPIIDTGQSGFNLKSLITQLIVLTFGGTILGIGFAFLLTILSHTIKYSFTYGWDADELFLQFDKKDSNKDIAHDMLVSNNTHLAVISENKLDDKLIEELNQTSKKVKTFESIDQLEVSEKVEEIILVVQRNLTNKDWYRKQRKHMRAYRDVNVKIAQI